MSKSKPSTRAGGKTEMLNIVIGTRGEMKKREGYKTLRGLITWLKKTNGKCRKHGWSGDFTFRLPMKP